MRTARIIGHTFLMYVVTHLFVFITLPYAILISLIDNNRLPVIKQWFVKTLLKIVGQEMKITGLDNVDPKQPYVIISNYPSFYAGFALIGTFPRASVVANAFIKRIPLLGYLMSRLGTVFVQPGMAGRGVRAIDMHLRKSEIQHGMIILPEGARTPDGTIQRFKRGFIYILRQTSLDLLPITLNGMYHLKPMKRFYLDPDSEIEMVIHPPVSNRAIQHMDDHQVLDLSYRTINSVYRP